MSGSVEKLIEVAKRHLSRLTACCGYDAANLCYRCQSSRKVVDAWKEYERSRVEDWPDEIPSCEKCGVLDNVGRWGVSEECWWHICEKCLVDKDGFTNWLAKEFKTVLDESEEYEKLPNGTYRLKSR